MKISDVPATMQDTSYGASTQNMYIDTFAKVMSRGDIDYKEIIVL
jgi:hypothetical protein